MKKTTLSVSLIGLLCFCSTTTKAQCEVARIIPAGGGIGAGFGRSGALYEHTAVIAAPYENGFGSARVFERVDPGTPLDPRDDVWEETALLLPAVLGSNSLFGSSVALGSNVAAVGASLDDSVATDSGTAYIFFRDDRGTQDRLDDVWVETAKLLASDALARDQFGHSMALWENTLIVGTRDGERVYVFERDDNGTASDPLDDTWLETHVLRPSDGVGPGIEFGWGLHIKGDTIAIGARKDDDFVDDSGSAYFFGRDDKGTPADRTDDTWVELFKVSASDPNSGVEFGAKVMLDDDLALVGSEEDNDLGGASGSVYVFARDDGGTPTDRLDDTWVEIQKLLGSTEHAGDRYGIRIAIEGDLALVAGIDHDFVGNSDGVCYVLKRERNGTDLDPLDDSFVEVAVLHPSQGQDADWFGLGLSLFGTDVLIGAPRVDGNPVGGGSAYVYTLADGLACATHRNGTQANPDVLRSTSLPVLGTTWTAELDTSGHPRVFATLVLGYDSILNPTSTGFGELLVAPPVSGGGLQFASIELSIQGLSVHSQAIPNDPALSGTTAFLQGVLLSGVFALTNSVDLILGV